MSLVAWYKRFLLSGEEADGDCAVRIYSMRTSHVRWTVNHTKIRPRGQRDSDLFSLHLILLCSLKIMGLNVSCN